jgi:isohexenylglutaconyl-CoA hydratase
MNTQDLTKSILTTRLHDVLFVTLNRPATRHALASDMVQGLEDIARAADSDATLRAIVLRGSNHFFCAGGDVGNFQSRLEDTATDHDPVALRNRKFGQFMELLGQIPVPVIAMVEGAAMGGGMGLACLSDIVLATQTAKFVLSETSLGIVPAQIMPFVVDRIGVPASRRMGLSAERVAGALALQLGLADELAADAQGLETSLARWLTQICKCAPHANRVMKKMAFLAATEPRGPFLDQAAHTFAATMRDEGMTGIASFRAREPAPWCVAFSALDIRNIYQAQGIGLLPAPVKSS